MLQIAASSSLQLQDPAYSRQILEEIYRNVPDLPSEYQKVLILSDLATLYCEIDIKTASDYLKQGIQKLATVEYDKEAIARQAVGFCKCST